MSEGNEEFERSQEWMNYLDVQEGNFLYKGLCYAIYGKGCDEGVHATLDDFKSHFLGSINEISNLDGDNMDLESLFKSCDQLKEGMDTESFMKRVGEIRERFTKVLGYRVEGDKEINLSRKDGSFSPMSLRSFPKTKEFMFQIQRFIQYVEKNDPEAVHPITPYIPNEASKIKINDLNSLQKGDLLRLPLRISRGLDMRKLNVNRQICLNFLASNPDNWFSPSYIAQKIKEKCKEESGLVPDGETVAGYISDINKYWHGDNWLLVDHGGVYGLADDIDDQEVENPIDENKKKVFRLNKDERSLLNSFITTRYDGTLSADSLVDKIYGKGSLISPTVVIDMVKNLNERFLEIFGTCPLYTEDEEYTDVVFVGMKTWEDLPAGGALTKLLDEWGEQQFTSKVTSLGKLL